MPEIGQAVFTTASIASASTTDIGATDEWILSVTGTTTITSFGIGANKVRFLVFAAALVLTHNGTSLILPGAASITTAAGDRCIAASDASGNWRVWNYTKANGKAVIGPASTDITDSTAAGRALLTAANVAAQLSALGLSDAMSFKTAIDCSANPNYPAADAGDTYKVSVAGKIGGASGPNVQAGDTLICSSDGTSAGNHATVGTSWVILQTNIDGAVTGPASSTNNGFVRFDGTTGKIVKDGAATVALGSEVSGTLPVANGGTGDTGTAWDSYTPTLTASSGSFTTTSASGRYKQIGKTVFFEVDVTITNKGTASGVLQVTLPFTAAARRNVIGGYERVATGVLCFGAIASGGTIMSIMAYNNTSLIIDTANVIMTGVYQAA